MNNAFTKIFSIFVLFTLLCCSGQSSDSFEMPIEGKLVFVEAIRGDGWLTANPFGELVIIDGITKKRQVLTWDGYYYAHPNLTADGTSLIFESKRTGNIAISGLSSESDIYQMDIESKEIKSLSEEFLKLTGKHIGDRFFHPSLSPSGDKLLFSRLLNWEYHLSYFSFEENKLIDITKDDNFRPLTRIPAQWSKDESHIIMTVLRNFDFYVVLVSVTGDTLQIISNNLLEERSSGEFMACISGSWIDSIRFLYMCSRTDLNYSVIYEYNINESKSKKLKKIYDEDIDFTIYEIIAKNDSENIIIIGGMEGLNYSNVYMMNLKSSELVKITDSETEKRWLRWYSD